MKAYGFIHCHSDYSLKDSTNKIEKLCLAAKEMGAKAITLTDHGVCAGHVEFLNACNAIGIKGIPGVEAYVQTDYADHAHLILLPMNYEGYQELCKAVTLSNQHMLTLGRIPSPVMNYEILESCFASGNVIASSACVNGVLSCILLHNKHILHEIDLLKRRQKKYPAPNTLEMKLLLFEIEKTSIEVEALRSEKEQTKKLAKKTYKKRLQGLASLQADSQVYIATKQKLENEMRETENAKEKLQHISAELKRKSSEVTRNKERVKKAQKSLEQWYKYESQIQEKNQEIEPDGKLISMAEKELLRFQKIFKGNFYVELQYHGMEDEAYVMPILAELAYRNGVSVVATNDVHIIRPEDAEGRSYLKSLRFEKFEPVTDSDRELYLKSDTELSQKLCEIIPENIVKSAIANIRVICDKCNVDIPRVPEAQHYPVFLNEEKELLGAYISGHPLEQFKLLKADKSITPLSHAEAEKPQIYMGVISNIKEFRQRNDGIGVTFDLEDWDGLASCIVFAQHYKQVQKYIKDGNVIKVYGYFNKQDEESFSNELIARQIFPCHPYSNHVFISFQSRTEWPDVCQSLKPYLVEQGHPVIFYECDNGSIREHLQFKGKEIFLNDDVLHLKTDAIRNIRKLNF